MTSSNCAVWRSVWPLIISTSWYAVVMFGGDDVGNTFSNGPPIRAGFVVPLRVRLYVGNGIEQYRSGVLQVLDQRVTVLL